MRVIDGRGMKKQTDRIRRALAFSMATAVTSSCSSIAVHSDPRNEPGPYAGTRLAVKETKRSWMAPKFYGEALFVMYDIPLSIITDTILLPLDASRGDSTGSEALGQEN